MCVGFDWCDGDDGDGGMCGWDYWGRVCVCVVCKYMMMIHVIVVCVCVNRTIYGVVCVLDVLRDGGV